MKPLPIRQALELYNLISPYLPELDEVDTGSDFVGKIIHNIVVDNKHEVYVAAIALMMDTTIENIAANLNYQEALSMFFEGLESNRIFDLQTFCKRVGLNG